jgi:hypothetical protein
MTENEELCLKVAKLKGLFPVQNTLNDSVNLGTIFINKDASIVSLGNCPESIADAWKLFEEMEKVGVGFSVFNLQHSDNHWSYQVTIYDPVGGPEYSEYHVEGSSVPLAICKAFIAWRESQ